MDDNEESQNQSLLQESKNPAPDNDMPSPTEEQEPELKIKHTLKLEEIRKIPIRKDKIIYFEKDKKIEDFSEFFLKKYLTVFFLIQSTVLALCL